jgi:hypothetical protein
LQQTSKCWRKSEKSRQKKMIKLNLNIAHQGQRDYLLSIIKLMLPAHVQGLTKRPYNEVMAIAKLHEDNQYLQSLTPDDLSELIAACSFAEDGICFENILLRNIHPRKDGAPAAGLRVQWRVKPQKYCIEYQQEDNWHLLKTVPMFDHFNEAKKYLADFVAQKKGSFFVFEETA